MDAHQTVDSLSESLLDDMSGLRSALIYAPNTVGKTRLAQHLADQNPDGVVLYNSFVEDFFSWDNEQVVLKIDLRSPLLRTIESQGLEGSIAKYFQAFTSGDIEPTMNLAEGEISFGIHKGDNRSADRIKISRAEESIFIWCVYYSVLSEAVETLEDPADLRTTTAYDGLTLAVIDDPVSSMDDVRIVSVALALAQLIKRAAKLEIKFLVTTHHALFFNVLFNSLRRSKKDRAYVLHRGPSGGWILKSQSYDSPFSYHLGIIEDIELAISENLIRRSHFNQFRALLEKTANFLGYSGGWGDLLAGPDAVLLTRILNLYSHDRLAEFDSLEVSDEYQSALIVEFREFLKAYRWERAN